MSQGRKVQACALWEHVCVCVCILPPPKSQGQEHFWGPLSSGVRLFPSALLARTVQR